MKAQESSFRINQEGYDARLPVCAVVPGTEDVILKDSAGKVVYTIAGSETRKDPASGDAVRVADFGILEAGTYELECRGEKRSLTVRHGAWRNVTDALIKGLYFQRCGCGLNAAHAGKYAHPACHTAPAAEWEDRGTVRSVPGGWHDAGDYGKYVGPGAVTVAHLLYAWKLFPRGCGNSLNIPETGNGWPDILNEAKYELDWILRMQREDGAFYHKLTKAQFAPFIMPQDDLEPEFLMPVSHCATAAACACLALGYRVYRAYDEEFSGRMLRAAWNAWEWLQAYPEFIPFRNPEGVRTGWYGDRSDMDERFWAACEMFAATGVETCRDAAEMLYAEHPALTVFGWAEVGGLGALCCLFDLKEKAGDKLYRQLREDFLRQSEEALRLSRESGYGTSLAAEQYSWGSILPIMSNAMAMIMNSLLTGRQDMRDAVLLQWHYALGMNAPDVCYVTGFGTRPVMHPHHRPSGADGIEDPVPGLIVGGPNRYFSYASTREKLGENMPPARCYLDETPSADTNEIAIYWNSPAVFTGSYINQLS